MFSLIVLLMLVGAVLYFIPMDGMIKNLILLLVVIVVIFFVAQGLGWVNTGIRLPF